MAQAQKLLGFSYVNPDEPVLVRTDDISVTLVNNVITSTGLTPQCLFAFTAGENLVKGEIVRVNNSNEAVKASADLLANSDSRLYVVFDDSKLATETVTVQAYGCVDSLILETGQVFITDAPYYLSVTEPGRITFVEPTVTDQRIVYLGSTHNSKFLFEPRYSYTIL